MGRSAVRKSGEGYFGGGVLRLPECGAESRAFEHFAVKVDGSFEARGVIGSFSYASVRREIEAAPLR